MCGLALALASTPLTDRQTRTPTAEILEQSDVRQVPLLALLLLPLLLRGRGLLQGMSHAPLAAGRGKVEGRGCRGPGLGGPHVKSHIAPHCTGSASGGSGGNSRQGVRCGRGAEA